MGQPRPSLAKGTTNVLLPHPIVALDTQRRNRNAAIRCHSVSLSDRIAFCKNDCSSMASSFTYLNTAEPDHSPARRMVPSALPWAVSSVARPALKAVRVNFCESSTRESDRNLRSVVVNVPVVKRKSGCPAERRARYGPNRCGGHKCGPNSLHKARPRQVRTGGSIFTSTQTQVELRLLYPHSRMT